MGGRKVSRKNRQHTSAMPLLCKDVTHTHTLDTAGCYECVIFKCCTQFNRFYGIYLKCTIGVAVCCYCLLLRGLSGSKLVKMDIKFTGSCTEMSRKYCFPPCPTTTHINVNPHWKSCTIWTTPRLFPLARTTGVITR